MNRTALFLLSLFFLLISSCEDNQISTKDDLQPGRRDYIWVADTLPGLRSPRYRMWGNSTTDIWATTSSNSEYSISHYDGDVWISYLVPGMVLPKAIYGFAQNIVYVGAENGKIWIYNGNNWELLTEIKNNDYYVFENMWGASPDDIYAIGAGADSLGYFNKSIIAHNNNGEWKLLDTNPLIGNVVQLFSNKSDGKMYILVYKIGSPAYSDSTLVYEYKNSGYYRLYSSPEIKGRKANLCEISDKVYFILGNQICIRTNDSFANVLDVSGYDFYGRIWGRNNKDIFLLMTDGLAHYNGINIEYLFHFHYNPGTQIYAASLFEQEVFFLAYEPATGLSFVYHGILAKGGND